MPEEVAIKAEKEKDKSTKASKKPKTVLNKVVIRRLPPNFSEKEFLESIAPTEYNDFYFVSADFSLGADATSRAYIELKCQEDIFLFKERFDGYIFLDSLKGTEYPAIVEYAPFQGITKSRARKDKHVNTIENEQHFQNFIENLKKAEESENQKSEGKLEFSFQLKDDKKITSTPLLEFLAAAKVEKREAKKKKTEERKKQREEEKQKKKKEVAKNIPEPIKESKEEIVYDDGVVVRTVPSRLNRNDKKKENVDKDKEAQEKERREKREKEREERKKIQREKEEKRRQEREQKKANEKSEKKTEVQPVASAPSEDSSNKQQPPKREVKRYSELRKARQEKSGGDSKDDIQQEQQQQQDDPSNENEAAEPPPPIEEDPRWKRIREAREKRAQMKQFKGPKNLESLKPQNDEKKIDEATTAEEEAKKRHIQDMRDRRNRYKEEMAKKESDERAARKIKNKDRPSMQIYRPKRAEGKSDGGNDKSSDEKSDKGALKRSDSIRSEKRDKRRRNSRDEKKRKGNLKRGSSNDEETVVADETSQKSTENLTKTEENVDKIAEKMEEFTLKENENQEIDKTEN